MTDKDTPLKIIYDEERGIFAIPIDGGGYLVLHADTKPGGGAPTSPAEMAEMAREKGWDVMRGRIFDG